MHHLPHPRQPPHPPPCSPNALHLNPPTTRRHVCPSLQSRALHYLTRSRLPFPSPQATTMCPPAPSLTPSPSSTPAPARRLPLFTSRSTRHLRCKPHPPTLSHLPWTLSHLQQASSASLSTLVFSGSEVTAEHLFELWIGHSWSGCKHLSYGRPHHTCRRYHYPPTSDHSSS